MIDTSITGSISKIKGFENYVVTKNGYIFNLLTGKELKQTKYNNGYMFVDLYQNGIKKHYPVHRLVATAFIPNTNNLPVVNHKDENKENNNADNLEWCTHYYNLSYGENAPLKNLKYGITAKEVVQYDLQGKVINVYRSAIDASKKQGFRGQQ